MNMVKIEAIKLDNNNKNDWIDIIAKQSWSASKFLAKALNNENIYNDYFKKGDTYVFTINNSFMGFATLSIKDCIEDDSLYPWIGFLFVKEEYRKNRYSQRIMEYLEGIAFKEYNQVYICTNHLGLYEKYGYEYLYDKIDMFNENERIYVKYKGED